ncbi:hypothetical protein GCM10023082_22700 [Streptomyces tremellae]|uniref:Uncharacterized protein n=1 Tax=Streptomyces tremellae TaxID=1124239 RepID=A0ABP7ET06_9ACTN
MDLAPRAAAVARGGLTEEEEARHLADPAAAQRSASGVYRASGTRPTPT